MGIQRLFIGRVTESGQLEMSTPVRALWQRHLDSLKGAPVEWTLRRQTKRMSDSARRYYFGCVVPLIAEHCGYEKEEMHEVLAMRFLRIDDCPITGAPRRRHLSSADDFKSKEGAEFIDACIRLASEMGVYVPQPGETA